MVVYASTRAAAVRVSSVSHDLRTPLAAIKGGNARYFILANPMTPIIESFRYGFLGTGVFDWWHLLYSALVAALLLVAGIVV